MSSLIRLTEASELTASYRPISYPGVGDVPVNSDPVDSPWDFRELARDYTEARWYLNTDMELVSGNIVALLNDKDLRYATIRWSFDYKMNESNALDIMKATSDVRTFYQWHSDDDGLITQAGYSMYRSFRDDPVSPQARKFPTTLTLFTYRTKLADIMVEAGSDYPHLQCLMAELVFANTVMAHLELNYASHYRVTD